jgi:hypothetical protein
MIGDLAVDAQKIGLRPFTHDAAILNAHDSDRVALDAPAGGWHAEELAGVGRGGVGAEHDGVASETTPLADADLVAVEIDDVAKVPGVAGARTLLPSADNVKRIIHGQLRIRSCPARSRRASYR